MRAYIFTHAAAVALIYVKIARLLQRFFKSVAIAIPLRTLVLNPWQ